MRALKTPGKLSLLVVALVTLMGIAGSAMATEEGTFAKALAQAKAENKMLVLDFYTDW